VKKVMEVRRKGYVVKKNIPHGENPKPSTRL
jgi:hypothetical protein